jgi:hypothetical protein
MDPRIDPVMLNWFRFHPATTITGPQHDELRAHFRALAEVLLIRLPGSPDKTVALRKRAFGEDAASSISKNTSRWGGGYVSVGGSRI